MLIGRQHMVKIETKLYTKPSAGNTILRADSYHPRHTKTSVPFSRFLRYRRNCSTLEYFDEQSITLKQKRINRGYSVDIVESADFKACAHDRNSLLLKTKSKDKNNDGATKRDTGDTNKTPIYFSTAYRIQ
ncbi:hypothetical protein XELAEV_18014008mg [Xenopus laevis]|uniref:Helix-turn-helix domain-containing protein n=1 Tax=Xenopus laevis TaxID=8355 RepID=A0A974HZK7_XENLA|nr:hypothetical protein XELAEV_18014008mg [Xenopus laevis]